MHQRMNSCLRIFLYEVKLMSHTFKGGVHPNYMKRPDIPITVIAPPPQVVIPMASTSALPASLWCRRATM